MLIEKQKKTCKKARSKNQNQSISMRKLLYSNSRAAELDTFKNILFDLATIIFEFDETLIFFSNQLYDNDSAFDTIFKTSATDGLVAVRLKSSKKKKIKGKSLFRYLNKEPKRKIFRSLIRSSIVMILIKSDKQKVKVFINVVENTSLKYIC